MLIQLHSEPQGISISTRFRRASLALYNASSAFFMIAPTSCAPSARSVTPMLIVKNNLVFMDTNLPAHLITHAIKLGATPYLCIDAVSISKSVKLPYDMQGVYLLKTDRHEASALANMPINSLEEGIHAAKIILQQGMNNLLITLGAEGYILANPSGAKYFAAIPLSHLVDVSGAGDAFVAALLAGLQRKMPLEESCQLGAAAAYFTLQSTKTVAGNFSFSDLKCFSLTV
ncbi:PfkB family carbohydrate kinase [Legionella lytica]|nr:PfkB family carbohydrate kinase [Legionella lytica]